MIALGVDSGSLSTGFGVVEMEANAFRAIEYGAIANKASTGHPERLARIHEGLRRVIREYRPDFIALEGVFMASNAQSALKLGQVRGAVMVTAHLEGVPIREFSPSEVKSAVTGYGRADKKQVQSMVKSLLGLTAIPRPHDAADALALALCGLTRDKWDRRTIGQ